MADPRETAAERQFIEEVLRAEASAVQGVIARLDDSIHRAVDILTACADAGGSVLVSGLGKSGLIGKKISATLASVGVPSHDIHPAEAAHGDLGRIRPTDCLIALSNSGETEEVVTLASLLKQDGVPIISITGGAANSALARSATVALSIGHISEASDLALAPTCSTTATLALGDALALAVARRRSFTADDFAKRHPGGLLGGLLRPVIDVLRFTPGHNLPIVHAEKSVRGALNEAHSLGRRPGAVLVVEDSASQSAYYKSVLTGAGMRVRCVPDAAQVPAALADFSAELILLDIYMPSCSGIELAAVLRQQERYVGIPIVYLSVEKDAARQIMAMSKGADDFLEKPVNKDLESYEFHLDHLCRFLCEPKPAPETEICDHAWLAHCKALEANLAHPERVNWALDQAGAILRKIRSAHPRSSMRRREAPQRADTTNQSLAAATLLLKQRAW